jgi:arylsulfatase A-like enzyme
VRESIRSGVEPVRFDERPNVLQIVIDDLGWADIGAYQDLVPDAMRPRGYGFYETPNVDDRLATEGTVFTDGYAASPVCSPTRASLYTGQATPRHGLTNIVGAGRTRGKLVSPKPAATLPPETPTQARLLADAGYETVHLGKWHVTSESAGVGPGDLGFETNVAGFHWGRPVDGYTCPFDMPNLDCSGEEYLTRALTDRAVSFIRDAPADRPFFVDMAYYSVHGPFRAPDDVVERFRRKRERMGLPDDPVVEGGQRVVQSDPTYAAMLYEMDRGVGRLLDAIEQRDRPTVVIFHSDNGGLASVGDRSPTSTLPLERGKGWPYEGGIRVPTIIRWPGLTDGAIESTPVITHDLYVTALRAAGVDLPDPERHPVDGVDLGPLLADSEIEDRAIHVHFPHYRPQGATPSSMIRHGEYKLLEFFEDDHTELYNVVADPGENLELSTAAPERASALRDRLHRWQADIGAELPVPNPEFDGDGVSPGRQYERQLETLPRQFLSEEQFDGSD